MLCGTNRLHQLLPSPMGFNSWYWAASPNSVLLLCCPLLLLLLLDPCCCCCWPTSPTPLLLEGCCCWLLLLLLLPSSSPPTTSAALLCLRLALLVSLGTVCLLIITTASQLHLEACYNPPKLHYTAAPPRASHPEKANFTILKKEKKIFCQIVNSFELFCRLPCERRQRLLATEVVSAGYGWARRSPRSRFGGAATASRQPTRVRRAHMRSCNGQWEVGRVYRLNWS